MKKIILPLLLLAGCDSIPDLPGLPGVEETKTVAIYQPEMGCREQGYLRVAHALVERPGDWKNDGYRLSNRNITLWVANEEYGLKILGDLNMEGVKIPAPCNKVVWAGVQKWSALKAMTVND